MDSTDLDEIANALYNCDYDDCFPGWQKKCLLIQLENIARYVESL